MINIAQPADDFNFLFRQLTGNKDYEKIIYKNIKEAAGMCSVAQNLKAAGRAEGLYSNIW